MAAPWPSRGTTPWDSGLRAYIDDPERLQAAVDGLDLPAGTPDDVGDIPGTVTLAQLPPGMIFQVVYDGTSWHLGNETGPVITARPTDRTDLIMECINTTGSTLPAWAIDGDRLWISGS